MRSLVVPMCKPDPRHVPTATVVGIEIARNFPGGPLEVINEMVRRQGVLTIRKKIEEGSLHYRRLF